MITATVGNGGAAPLVFYTSVGGIAVYLDNWAVIEFAKHNDLRRERLITALNTGRADLMFSVANAAELSGPQGKSATSIREFLNRIGAHWFPVEMDVFEVLNRESSGAAADACCVCSDLVRAFFESRISGYGPGSGKVIDLSENFFALGPFVDWLTPQNRHIKEMSLDFDELLKNLIGARRAECEQDPSLLGRLDVPFHRMRPATFVVRNLLKTLIVEAKSHQLKEGDALDFCHAVMATAFGSIGALDTEWKRRVGTLPSANSLARIYGPSELDEMIADIEGLVEQLEGAGPGPDRRE